MRVLRLLELGEFFEGVVSCDYGAKDFSCKPEAGTSELILPLRAPPDAHFARQTSSDRH